MIGKAISVATVALIAMACRAPQKPKLVAVGGPSLVVTVDCSRTS